MKLYTKTYEALEGMEPFEVQDIKEGVKIELFYMNDTPLFNELTRKGQFAVFSTKDGKNYRLLIEKGYYEVMKELYDVETNTIWEQFWEDVNKCRTSYIYKILLPFLLIYLVASYAIIALTKGNFYALIGCVFVVFLVTAFLNSWNKQKMQKINYEAGNKIREIKGAKHFEELSKAQELYHAKFFGYEDEIKKEENEVVENENSNEELENVEIENEEVEVKEEE